MKVITLAKRFPAYHPRRGEQTDFSALFISGEKIHTIRKNEKGYYQDGDIVSVRQWEAKPYYSKQEVVCDGVKIAVVPVQLFFNQGGLSIYVSASFQHATIIACNDGLSTGDFYNWFNPKKKPYLMLNYSLIYFTDFRYA